jgi:hypothetical protein
MKRKIKVVQATQDVITFDKPGFTEGDILVDIKDQEHDIELLEKIKSTKNSFAYLGTARVGEIYTKQ